MVDIPIRKIKIKLAFIGSLEFYVLFSCCDKHNDQKQLRKKELISSYNSIFRH